MLFRSIKPLQEEVKARGLWAAHLPPDLGGMGFGQVRLGLMHEILGQSPYAPLVFGNNAPDSGNAELLAVGMEMTGRHDIRERWMQPLLDGRLRSGFSMTEPHTAGSDPRLLQTRAVRDGDEWVITGRKWYTTNGSVADILVVMAVTNPDVHPYQGSSMFVVPVTTPGVKILRDVGAMDDPQVEYGRFGNHAEILYDDVRIPADHLIGPEGAGFLLAQARLGPGRIHHCMRWLGQSQRAFDMMCERVLSRETAGSLLADKQFVQGYIADSYAQLVQFRLFVLYTAWEIDKYNDYKRVRKDIATAKVVMPTVLHDIAWRAMQVHGALGTTNEMPFFGMIHAAGVMGLADGPTEVHKVTVARQVLRDYRPAEGMWPSEWIPAKADAARATYAHLLDLEVGNL